MHEARQWQRPRGERALLHIRRPRPGHILEPRGRKDPRVHGRRMHTRNHGETHGEEIHLPRRTVRRRLAAREPTPAGRDVVGLHAHERLSEQIGQIRVLAVGPVPHHVEILLRRRGCFAHATQIHGEHPAARRHETADRLAGLGPAIAVYTKNIARARSTAVGRGRPELGGQHDALIRLDRQPLDPHAILGASLVDRHASRLWLRRAHAAADAGFLAERGRSERPAGLARGCEPTRRIDGEGGERAGLRQREHGSRRRAGDLRGREHGEGGRLDHLLAAVGEPAEHERAGRLPQRLREAMLCVGLGDGEPIGTANEAVYPLGIAHRPPGVADIKEIPRGGADERWPRRPHEQVISVVHAEGELAEDVLLGVLRADGAGEFSEQARDVAGDGRGGDAVVEGGDIARLRAAAAVAHAAETVGADAGPRGEIVEAADAVVDHPRREVAAERNAGGAHDGVFGDAIAAGGLPVGVAELPPLPLADRVEEERGDAVRREEGGGPLVGVVSLADVNMPAGHEHRRPRLRKPPLVGEEEGSGHMDARLARVDDLLDRVARFFDAAGHLRGKRRPLRKRADRHAKGIAKPPLPRGHIGWRRERRPLLAPRLGRAVNGVEQVPLHHAGAGSTSGIGRGRRRDRRREDDHGRREETAK